MLKEAIEKIREMVIDGAEIKTIQINDDVFARGKDGELKIIAHKPIVPSNVTVTSLEGFVCWVKNECAETPEAKLFVEVSDYNTVNCRTERGFIEPGKTCNIINLSSRNNLFSEGFRGYEEAMIELRSKYQHTDDIDYLLKLLSSMTLENSVKSDDNGLNQQVTVRKGIALTENVPIKPIVKLKPYRTFFEVEQPESEFLLRIGDGGQVGLFEADGGMWKMTARYTIKSYLQEALKEEINDGIVIVTL